MTAKKHKRKAAMDMDDDSPSAPTKLLPNSKVSAKDKISKKKRRHRFCMPFSVVCKGCDSVISEDVKVNAIKEIVGKIRNYNIKCPCCGSKFLLERTSGEIEYKIVRGAVFDWAGWKKECSKAHLDAIAPGSSERYNIFDIFQFSTMVGDPMSDGPFQAV